MTKKVSSSKDGDSNSSSKWCWMVFVSAFYTVNLSQLSTNKIEHLLACIFFSLHFGSFFGCFLCVRVRLYEGREQMTYAHNEFSRINSIDTVYEKKLDRTGKINVNAMWKRPPTSDIGRANETESTKNEREICLFGGDGVRDHLEICYAHTQRRALWKVIHSLY